MKMAIAEAGATVKVGLMILPVHCWFKKWEKARNAAQVHKRSGKVIMNLPATRGTHCFHRRHRHRNMGANLSQKLNQRQKWRDKGKRRKKQNSDQKRGTAQNTTEEKKTIRYERQLEFSMFLHDGQVQNSRRNLVEFGGKPAVV